MGRVYGNFVARQVENARLVAVADSQAAALEDFTSRVDGVKGYADYHDLLQDRDVEAVIIVTPTSTHREVVIAAAEAKKAIFCEKPTALTLKATDDMLTVVDAAGVLFYVGFMRRFDKGCAAARKQIDAGAIGEVVMVRSIGRDPFRTSLEYANPAVSGGLILDMAIHDFDLARWYMGAEVERVYTEVASLVYPELQTVGDVDNAMISLRFTNGGLGNIEATRTAPYGYDIQCTVVGTKGALQIGYLQETPLLLMTKAGGVQHDVVPHFPERFGTAYTAQIAHFIDCLTLGVQPAVTPADARVALQAAIAATRSQQEGRVVYVSEVQA
jgi:predicted dehydrogenase